MIEVRHSSAFKPYRLDFPIDWKADPYSNKNWMHHFNSLRWLPAEKNLDLIEKTLRDFYNFHCIKKNKNPYYNELRGDHTAAIRLDVLIKINSKFQTNNSISGIGICNRLIKAEIKNLHNEKIYRAGHNHGLMIDLALLDLAHPSSGYSSEIQADLIIERSGKTLDAMWHSTGLTKEHSVSYQEFNILLTLKYFERLDELKIEPRCQVRMQDILMESRRFLGYALKKNGEYFPLGDSFRIPNLQILQKVYGGKSVIDSTVFDLLFPFSLKNGAYTNDHFFIFRGTVENKKIHFAATCCWDSHNHKQNDELSFCLEIDGVTVFDDLGYTEFLPWEKILELKSEENHSTINIEGHQWSNVVGSNGRSKIVKANFDDLRFVIEMTASRVEGFNFHRKIELKNNILSIYDSIEAANKEHFKANRKFIFGKSIELCQASQNMVHVLSDGQDIACISFDGGTECNSSLQIRKSDLFVCSDRKVMAETYLIKENAEFSAVAINRFRTVSVRF